MCSATALAVRPSWLASRALHSHGRSRLSWTLGKQWESHLHRALTSQPHFSIAVDVGNKYVKPATLSIGCFHCVLILSLYSYKRLMLKYHPWIVYMWWWFSVPSGQSPSQRGGMPALLMRQSLPRYSTVRARIRPVSGRSHCLELVHDGHQSDKRCTVVYIEHVFCNGLLTFPLLPIPIPHFPFPISHSLP